MRTFRKTRLVLAQGALVATLLMPGLVLADTAQPATTPAPTTANTPTTQAAQTNTQAPGSATGQFVPLTHFPQITQLAQSQGFSDFVNALYKICIGLGAVLAVLMIMYAGVQIMTSRGSVSSNEKAKSRIQNAVLGLILVLAPTIVFGIINPEILNLNLGTEFIQLKPQQGIQQGAFASPSTTPSSTLPSNCSAYTDFRATPVLDSCSADFGSSFTQVAGSCCSITDPSSGACCARSQTNGSTAANQYEWKAIVTSNPNGNLNNLYGLGSSPQTNTRSGGPFSTQQACTDNYNVFVTENSGSSYTLQCNCGQPVSQQPSCSK